MNMTMNHDDTIFILALALASNQTHKDTYSSKVRRRRKEHQFFSFNKDGREAIHVRKQYKSNNLQHDSIIKFSTPLPTA